jgi:hypothetical protein
MNVAVRKVPMQTLLVALPLGFAVVDEFGSGSALEPPAGGASDDRSSLAAMLELLLTGGAADD